MSGAIPPLSLCLYGVDRDDYLYLCKVTEQIFLAFNQKRYFKGILYCQYRWWGSVVNYTAHCTVVNTLRRLLLSLQTTAFDTE